MCAQSWLFSLIYVRYVVVATCSLRIYPFRVPLPIHTRLNIWHSTMNLT